MAGKMGVIIAFTIILLWATSLSVLLSINIDFRNPLTYLMIFVQMHLYTGLFITAHDAMHGTVSRSRFFNYLVGQTCTLLYALFPFKKLNTKHHQHHQFVHSKNDPDYHHGNFFVWYFKFITEYLSWWQIVLMAIIFNIAKIWIPEQNLILFWILPSLLSTLQLFYFGTWLPHHGEHENVHHSRTQDKNHLWAFLTCYFFGYHFEHHNSPGTPWWKLWQSKHPLQSTSKKSN